ncbi:MAG: hypothetical protein EPO21_04880 [Chloroflexota bacterium]|nr:MAG: hypothetical protein EPO21_04880 [Chloroflexota bacterium]
MPQPPIKRPAPPPQEHDWQPGQGGSISFGRLRMEIEPGTFSEPVRLRLSAPDAPPPVPRRLTIPFVFRVEAHGSGGQPVRTLARPIHFDIDFSGLTPAELGYGYVGLYYFDEDTRRWTGVPAHTDMEARRITAQVGHFTDFGFGADDAQQPSLPSNLEGYQVDLCTGYAGVSIPLKVPPGTAGLTPDLTLSYTSGFADMMNVNLIQDGGIYENSRTRLQSSPVGFGWSLDLGYVTRTIPLDPDVDSGSYSLTLNGRNFEIVPSGELFEYRTKPDEYLRLRMLWDQSAPNVFKRYWVVETKDGIQYRFGYTSNSEMRAAKYNFSLDGTPTAWQWNLDQIKDTHGNTIDIEYDKVTTIPNNGDTNDPYDQASYPLHINYTANSDQSLDANRQITFVYSDRSDQSTGSHVYFPYTQYYWKKKLDRIEMRVGGAMVRTYEFTHDYRQPYWHYADYEAGEIIQTPGLDKLVLTQLTEKNANGNPLPATTFAYYVDQVWSGQHAKLQLYQATNGYGGKVTYAYEAHNPNQNPSFAPLYRVTQKIVESGLGSAGGVDCAIVLSYTYGTSYGDGYVYRGHGNVTVTDAAGHFEKSWFYTRDPINGKTGVDVERLQSRRYKLERWKSGAQTPTFTELTDWGWTGTAGPPYNSYYFSHFPRLDAVHQYTGNRSRKTRYEYDSYGNVIRTKEYDSATAADNAWVRNKRRWYGYTVDSSHYIVGKLANESIYKPGGGDPAEGDCVRATHYCYDGSYNWAHNIGDGLFGDDQSFRGRLTSVRQVLDGTSCVDVTYDYDGYGNRTSETEYGAYGTTLGALATGDPRTTSVTYESTYHTFPSQITNPIGQVQTRSYDARWGKPTSSTDLNGGVTDYAYDSFGRLTSVQGPQVSGANGAYRRTTQYTYYSPSTVNDRTTTQLLIQTRTDLGGTATWLNTRRFYDGIGRLAQEYSDGYSGVNVVNTYFDGRGLQWKESVFHSAAGTGAFLDDDWAGYTGAASTYTYDELQRLLVTTLPDGKTTESRYFDWSTLVLDPNGHGKLFDRDAFGRVYAIGEYSGTDPMLNQYATTIYGYDVLDQLTLVRDHANNVTMIGYDTLGRKIALNDPDMGVWMYAYDPIGTLSVQRDAKEQYVYFNYDALKRLVRKWYPASWTQPTITAGSSKPTVHDLMELRAAVDVDRKAAGLSPATWTDPAIVAGTGVRVRAIHFIGLRDRIQELWTAASMGSVPGFTGGTITADTRKIKASDLTDLRGWLVQYEDSYYGQGKRARVFMEYDAYDGASQFGRGKRTAIWDGCGRQSFWWDKAGRMTKEERTIDGALYATQWTYDAMDRVHRLTYPDGEVLTYSYAGNGLLSQITSSLGVTLVSGAQYNALNLPTRFTLGSGTTAEMRHTYYGPDAPGWPFGAPRTIELQQGTNPPLVYRSMVYDPVGNVISITDGVNFETITYGYDHLDRLLSASAPNGETYSYDEIGNMTSKNGGNLSYDANHKHAVSAFSGATYSYDANGCLTSTTARGGQAFSYDPEIRPVRVDAGGATVTRFAYDGDSGRRKRLDVKGTVHAVGSYERNVGNGIDTSEVVTKYYTASLGKLSRLIAFRRGGTLYWVGTDHLGSTIRVTDANFNAVDGMRYLPYGGSRDTGTNLQTDHLFTSQVLDASIGLYWYNSRAYDPVLGRFLVPDTIVPNAMNPQSLNRYSYGRNNPLRYTDPSGHDEEDWFSEDWKQAFRDTHDGADPTESDYADRYSSMAEASGYENTEAPEWVAAAAAAGGDAGGSIPSGPTLEPRYEGPTMRAWEAGDEMAKPVSEPAGSEVGSGLINAISAVGDQMPSVSAAIESDVAPSAGKLGIRVAGKAAAPIGVAFDAWSGYQGEISHGHEFGRGVVVGGASAFGGWAGGAAGTAIAIGIAGALTIGTGGTILLAIPLVVGLGWAGSSLAAEFGRGVSAGLNIK